MLVAAAMASTSALLEPAVQARIQPEGELSRLQARAVFEPQDMATRYRLGLLLAALEPADALDHLDAVAAAGNADSAAARALARSIRAAREVDDPAFSLVTTGRALASIGEWALATEALERALGFAPEYAEAWAYLGEARQHLGGSGLEELQTALELDPRSLAANLFLGLYWQRQGDFARAESFLKAARLLEPDNPTVHIQLGWNMALAGEPLQAREHFYAARDLATEDVEVWKAIARYSAEFEVYVEETGLVAAYRAQSMAPQDPEVLVLMGRLLALIGDVEEAIDYYEQALDAAPEHVDAYLHLGLAELQRQDRASARAAFERVIALAPESAAAAFAAELIAIYSP